MIDADFWQSVQNAARQEIARSACQLLRAEVVAVQGTKVNVRREHNADADGIFYPILDGLVVPVVGEYVWCLYRTGGLVILGRNLDASDKLADYATDDSVDRRVATPQSNDVQGATPPSAYPPASVSVKIRGSGTGFPTSTGTLVTFGSHHAQNYAFTAQMWFPTGTNQIWLRSGTAEDTWGEWRNLGDNTMIPAREWRNTVGAENERYLTHNFGRLPYMVTGWMRRNGTADNWRQMPTSPSTSGLDVYITNTSHESIMVKNTSTTVWEIIVYAW